METSKEGIAYECVEVWSKLCTGDACWSTHKMRHPHVPGCRFLSLELLTGDPCWNLQPYTDLIAIMCRIESSGRSCLDVLRVPQNAGR